MTSKRLMTAVELAWYMEWLETHDSKTVAEAKNDIAEIFMAIYNAGYKAGKREV